MVLLGPLWQYVECKHKAVKHSPSKGAVSPVMNLRRREMACRYWAWCGAALRGALIAARNCHQGFVRAARRSPRAGILLPTALKSDEAFKPTWIALRGSLARRGAGAQTQFAVPSARQEGAPRARRHCTPRCRSWRLQVTEGSDLVAPHVAPGFEAPFDTPVSCSEGQSRAPQRWNPRRRLRRPQIARKAVRARCGAANPS
jgi:hypothetical protein